MYQLGIIFKSNWMFHCRLEFIQVVVHKCLSPVVRRESCPAPTCVILKQRDEYAEYCKNPCPWKIQLIFQEVRLAQVLHEAKVGYVLHLPLAWFHNSTKQCSIGGITNLHE